MRKAKTIYTGWAVYAIAFFIGLYAAASCAAQKNGMRIIIATTGKAAYSTKKLDKPLRIVIEFSSRNVFTNAAGETAVNNGALSAIRAELYEDRKAAPKPLKSLTFYLAEDAPYRITQEGDNILIDILDTEYLKGEKTLELAGGKDDIEYASRRNAAIESAIANIKTNAGAGFHPLRQAKAGAKDGGVKMSWQDIFYLSALSLCVFLLIRVRRDWSDFKRDVLKKRPAAKSALPEREERRKWWRHSLAPLGRNIVSLEFAPLDEREKKIKVTARDIGYGGASFHLPIIHRRLPFDKPVVVNISLPDGTSVHTEGTLIWQRNLSDILHSSFGVVFTKHLHSEWDKINRFIEDRYALLSS